MATPLFIFFIIFFSLFALCIHVVVPLKLMVFACAWVWCSRVDQCIRCVCRWVDVCCFVWMSTDLSICENVVWYVYNKRYSYKVNGKIFIKNKKVSVLMGLLFVYGGGGWEYLPIFSQRCKELKTDFLISPQWCQLGDIMGWCQS